MHREEYTYNILRLGKSFKAVGDIFPIWLLLRYLGNQYIFRITCDKHLLCLYMTNSLFFTLILNNSHSYLLITLDQNNNILLK